MYALTSKLGSAVLGADCLSTVRCCLDRKYNNAMTAMMMTHGFFSFPMLPHATDIIGICTLLSVDVVA